jgi:glycosyltransferase involved in cell wall biosynthesis
MAGLIAHEWIEQVGGAERVLDEFMNVYPEADMFCLWNDAPHRYQQTTVLESVLARSPLRGKKALALPMMPYVWSNVPGDYDWMLISSHLFAHHARVRGVPAERTYVYVHTPARYLWSPDLDSRGKSIAVRAVAPIFRAVDKRRAQSHVNVSANSHFVRERIQEAWGIDASVIHPPVQVTQLQSVADWADALSPREREWLERLPENFILGASRFVPYKRLDYAIDAARVSGLPVVIAGSGPEEANLRAHAERTNVESYFAIRPSNALLAALLQRAMVYVFPSVEDFGILPVEAMALGTPVVVNSVGGASESVVDGVTGVTLASFDDRSLRAAIEKASAIDAAAAMERARLFDATHFQDSIRAWMEPTRVGSVFPNMTGVPS